MYPTHTAGRMPDTLNAQMTTMISAVRAIGKLKYTVCPRTDHWWFQLELAAPDDGYHSYCTRKPTTTPVAERTTDQPIQ